jgi:hypothetical protein
VHVSEVHFNHDPLTLTGDAMTIRQNRSEGRIAAPEWKRGLPPKPAAYASAPLGSTVTIKAKFGGGPPGETLDIRAVDADRLTGPSGCLGLLVFLFLALIRALGGNVLGNVASRSVAFDAAGNSALVTMTLTGHRLKTSGIGDRVTNWNWEYRAADGWTKFDQTRHRIFVVLDTPRAPWSQRITPEVIAFSVGGEVAYIDNTQLPWVDALEVACSWAQGVTEKHEAASVITVAVNSKTPQVYNTITNYGAFHLTWYLADLKAGAPFQTNCTDCANAVTTLGNLLGCDLYSQYLSTSFEPTKPFLTLNGDPTNPSDWVSYIWSYHEFAWIGPPNQTGSVYDACLRVDVDDDPDDDVHIARHPLAMPFTSYSPRLWDQAGGIDHQSRRSVY